MKTTLNFKHSFTILTLLLGSLFFSSCGAAATKAAARVANITGCPADITRAVAATGDTDLVVTWEEPTALSRINNPIPATSIVSTPRSGSTFTIDGSPATVQYIVTDGGGFTEESCSFTVTVTAS